MATNIWRTKAMLTVSALVATVFSAMPVAEAAEGDTDPGGQWVSLGGDEVHWVEDGASDSFTINASCTGGGYTLSNCSRALDLSYRIRLVRSGDSNGNGTDDAEEIRAEANAAASHLTTKVSGVTFSVASGLVTVSDKKNLDPGTREVYIVVHGDTPCGPGFAGCGGTRGDDSSSISDVPYLDGGAAWIYPVVLGYSGANQQHVVSHELGHAFGLRHYNSQYKGEWQVMHESRYDAANFRTGDRNGLRTERNRGHADHIGYGTFSRGNWSGVGTAVAGTYEPFAGDFDGNGYDDVFWYRPGSGQDYLWWFDAGGHQQVSININRTYRTAVGDYDADGRDDILWYDLGDNEHTIYWGNANRDLEIGATNHVLAGDHIPLAGDFNGDLADDVLFYTPGHGDNEDMWWGTPGLKLFSSTAGPPINATYQPFVGNFDGDGEDDIFWYRPGTGADIIYWGDPTTRITLEFAATTEPINRSYHVAVGDYDGDNRDDIVWYRVGASSDVAYFGRSDRTFDGMSISHSGNFTIFAGNFDDDTRDDIFSYRPG